MTQFFFDCKKARFNAPQAFDQARKVRNFWGKYHYSSYQIKQS